MTTSLVAIVVALLLVAASCGSREAEVPPEIREHARAALKEGKRTTHIRISEGEVQEYPSLAEVLEQDEIDLVLATLRRPDPVLSWWPGFYPSYWWILRVDERLWVSSGRRSAKIPSGVVPAHQASDIAVETTPPTVVVEGVTIHFISRTSDISFSRGQQYLLFVLPVQYGAAHLPMDQASVFRVSSSGGIERNDDYRPVVHELNAIGTIGALRARLRAIRPKK